MRTGKRKTFRRSHKNRKVRYNKTKRVGGKKRRGGATPTFSNKEVVSPTHAMSDPSFTGKKIMFQGKTHDILSDIDSKNYFIALEGKNGNEVYPKLKTIKRLNKQEKTRSKRK